jgi:processive 1,2-diacylglycerol beta-glucosyltransferase
MPVKRILILTAGYGEGHNSAARALKAAFDEQPGTKAELVDIFALRAPRLNNVSRRGYLGLINTAPWIWSGVYRWLDRSSRAPALFRTLGSHRRLLAKILEDRKPVALIATYPVYAWLLNRLRAEGLEFCPHYTVITDAITINSLWYRTPSAGWFVTDSDSAAYLRQQGVPAERVHVSGFPVALAFADRPPHLVPTVPMTRHLIGDMSPERAPRILFMINSARGPALRIARELLKQPGWHLTITAGRDAALRHELERMASDAPAKAVVLGWTDRIPELLMSHHVVISKAGGATTQESINALCPMLISQIVPGQEEGNYELLRRHEAGALATTPEAIIATLQHAFADDAVLWRRWRANLQKLARPAAARDIAARVLPNTTLPIRESTPPVEV